MPILRPEVSRLIKVVNDSKPAAKSQQKEMKDLLDDAGLSLEDTLLNLRNLRDMSDSENTKMRVNETVLKLLGVMKDEPTSIPSVNIIIESGQSPNNQNSILFPRELHKLNEVKTNDIN